MINDYSNHQSMQSTIALYPFSESLLTLIYGKRQDDDTLSLVNTKCLFEHAKASVVALASIAAFVFLLMSPIAAFWKGVSTIIILASHTYNAIEFISIEESDSKVRNLIRDYSFVNITGQYRDMCFDRIKDIKGNQFNFKKYQNLEAILSRLFEFGNHSKFIAFNAKGVKYHAVTISSYKLLFWRENHNSTEWNVISTSNEERVRAVFELTKNNGVFSSKLSPDQLVNTMLKLLLNSANDGISGDPR